MDDEYKAGISITFAICLFMAFCVMKGCEYCAKDLDVRRACVVAGRTPLECGLVRVQ